MTGREISRLGPLSAARLFALAAVICALLALIVGQRLHPVALSGAGSGAVAASAPAPLADTLGAPERAALSERIGAKLPAYRIRDVGGIARAVNPAQDLRVAFPATGAVVSTGSLQLPVGLGAVGWGRRTLPLVDVVPRHAGNRVVYSHGAISEWYVNGPLGLEQGFTVARPPAGRGDTLSLALGSDLTDATLAADGQSVTVSALGGESLRYGHLGASDASGRTLASSLALERGRLVIRVDLNGAQFPVRVDPTVEQKPEVKLLAQLGQPGEGADFGRSIAMSADGSTVLVGAPGTTSSSGGAWAFTRSNGTWVQQGKKLQISGNEEEAPCTGPEEDEEEPPGEPSEEACAFGRSVAISGDGQTAILGSPRAHDNDGAAWIFTRSGTEWTQVARLLAPGIPNDAHFGRSVALSQDGQTALVGAPAAAAGAAWIFTGSGSNWSNGEELVATQEQGDARFGRSVALSGDGSTALVGGPADAEGRGAAWAFSPIGPGPMPTGIKLTAGPSGSAGGHFGFDVALSGTGATGLVGAYREGPAGAGVAWLFSRGEGNWQRLAHALHGAGLPEELFGFSVAMSADGNSALVGAPRATTIQGQKPVTTGVAWLFAREGEEWTATKTLVGGQDESGKARFAASVAVSANAEELAVGGPQDSQQDGAAWVFGPAPSIEALTPSHGPTQGGTKVTIVGEHLLRATAVLFGATPALEFQAESETVIVAKSPPGTGAVDVSVEGPNGVSALNPPNDVFTYTEKGEGGAGSGKGHKGEEQTGGVGGQTGAENGQGSFVLGSGPTGQQPGAQCQALLRSKAIAVRGRRFALLKLRGTGPGACSGKLRLRIRTHLAHHRLGTKTIGTAIFSVLPGQRLLVRVKLNAAGRARLAAGHGALNASLLLVRQSPGPQLARTASVHLRAQHPKPKPHTH
jgi:hypothetical protein